MEVLEAGGRRRAASSSRGSERPDVVLLDVMMPGLDGWRVAEQLLEDERTTEIPIIFLTARAEFRDRARGLDIGGVDYVTKPFNPLELAPLVRELLERIERGERDELRGEKLAELRFADGFRLSAPPPSPRSPRLRATAPASTRSACRPRSRHGPRWSALLALSGPSARAMPAGRRPRRRAGPPRATPRARPRRRPWRPPARASPRCRRASRVTCRIAPTISVNGTIGAEDDHPEHERPDGEMPRSSRRPWSETVRATVEPGKLHHGCATVQKTVAKKKPQASSEIGSRRPTSRSASRRYTAKTTAETSAKTTPRPSSATPLQSSHHEREPGQRQRERDPDAAADVLVPERARPDRDEQRPDVLDEERDPDGQPVDGEEVEELHEARRRRCRRAQAAARSRRRMRSDDGVHASAIA